MMLSRPSVCPISVVIPSARAFPAGLIELLDAELGAGDEVFVVRNLPPARPGRWAGVDAVGADWSGPRSRPGRARCTVLTSPAGAAAARNAGWRRAGNLWVLFIDDDVAPGRGFIAAVRAAGLTADAGVITFRVISRASAIKPLVEKTISLDRGASIRSTNSRSIDLPDAWQFGVGAVMLVRRDVLADTGGFKDRLGAGRRNGGAEDLEFLWHASRHTSVLYRGDVSVIHSDVTTPRDVGRKLRQYGRAIGSVSDSSAVGEGYCMTREYCGHLWRAALWIRRPDLPSIRRRVLFNLQIAFAFLETFRVFTFSRWRSTRRDALCARCRCHA
jgi:glycosyltransferase involved in cell wall biosynthesis